MQGADKGEAADLSATSGAGLRIGIVQARFNAPLTAALAESCLAELAGARRRRRRRDAASPCPARWRCRWRWPRWPPAAASTR